MGDGSWVGLDVHARSVDLAHLVPVPEGEAHAGPLVIDTGGGADSKKAGPRP